MSRRRNDPGGKVLSSRSRSDDEAFAATAVDGALGEVALRSASEAENGGVGVSQTMRRGGSC